MQGDVALHACIALRNTHHSPTGSNTAAGVGADTVPEATNSSTAQSAAGPMVSSSISISVEAAIVHVWLLPVLVSRAKGLACPTWFNHPFCKKIWD
jgi:hypothetical protein